MSGYAACERCKEPIIWVLLNGKQCPLDRVPDDQGDVWAWHHAPDGWSARAFVAGEPQPGPQWKRYGIHDGGCADASGPQEDARNVTQLDTWRKAQSAHAAAQRRGRWRSASAQNYLGYRR